MQTDSVTVLTEQEQLIIDALRADPDFFTRHPHLLSELNLPHDSGRAVSLIEHQVAILRERNMRMRQSMNELVQAARDNDVLFTKTRSLTLALLDASSVSELNEVLATFVLVDFEADFVCCHLEQSTHSFDHIRNHETLPFAHLLTNRAPLCTTLRENELLELFPMSTHEDSGSAVILPLTLNRSEAVLAIGSRDPARFTKDMDTLFVTYIADVLSKVLERLGI